MPALERELEAAGKNFSAAQRALGDFAKAVSKLESDRGKPLAALRELEKTADELGGKLHPFSATLPAPGAEDGLRQELQNRGKLYRGQSEKLRETAASMQEEARKAEEAKLRAVEEARAAEEARKRAIEERAKQLQIAAEQKAARDARYAARKARKK
jgi:hypothetical protein